MNYLLFLYNQKPLIGVKGRLQSKTIEEEEKNKTVMELVAEKVVKKLEKTKNPA